MSSLQSASPAPLGAGLFSALRRLTPGVALTAAIAALAFALRMLPGVSILSPLILSILIGMAFHNIVGTPRIAKPGVAFALRRILRLAIILLGFQLTIAQVMAVGLHGLAIVITTLVSTFLFTVWLGRRLGVDRKLAELIAAGTSICGASAVIATNTVTQGRDDHVAYAVACVTVFGSLAMFLYPLLPAALHLGPHAFGLWAGSSIHEIAQVVAAAFQNGKESGDLATIAKLSRVMMLAPVVLTLGFLARWRRPEGRGAGRAAAPLPWFVFGFIALIGINSVVALPPAVQTRVVAFTTFLLSIALAAMGLETDIGKLKAEGLRPLLLGAGAWLFIASFSLLLVKLFA